jgi:predicted RNA methylase
VQAHVFAEDPSAALDVAIGTGTFVRPQDFGCFPTPMELVQQMMQRADIQPGMRVLEPSAGDGAIANAAAAAAGSRSLVTAVELLPGNVRKLHAAGFTDVLEKDFLTLEPQPSFDVVCMNPPFGKMADIDHVLHAARFLKPTGRLVAITSPSWTSNSARKAQSFKDFVSQAQGEVLDVAAGAFAAAGTNIATRLISMEAVNFPWNRLAAQEQDALGRPRMRACA